MIDIKNFYKEITLNNNKSYKGIYFFKATVIIIGILCLISSILPLTLYNVFNQGSIALLIISALFFIYAIFLSPKNLKYSAWRNNRFEFRMLRILSIFMGICVAIEVMFTCFMIYKSIKKPPQNSNATAIVMGCATFNGKPSNMLYYRLNAAKKYLDKNPQAKVIVSGGITKNDTVTQAKVMEQWLLNNGIDKSRIFAEHSATDTDTNIKLSKEIIEKENLSHDAVIVTDSFHQARSVIYAEKYGLNPSSVSSFTPPLMYPIYFIREQMGIIEAYLFS